MTGGCWKVDSGVGGGGGIKMEVREDGVLCVGEEEERKGKWIGLEAI